MCPVDSCAENRGSAPRPVVGVVACRKQEDDSTLHFVHDCYVSVVHDYMQALPVLMPSVGEQSVADAWLDGVDGLLFTGSGSNVDPRHYGQALQHEQTLLDPQRDDLTLPLVRRALQLGVPFFGICRGFQEINVAFGGSLWQQLHQVDGFHDHRPDRSLSLEQQYEIKHRVSFPRGSWLRQQLGQDNFLVNSRHTQGVQRLGEGLEVEARADDGVIEAFRVRQAQTFAYAVQWHPEWRPAEDRLSRVLFDAFGQACRLRARERA